MDISIGNFRMSVASLNVFNSAVILIATPLMDRCVYPWIESVRGVRLALLPRIGLGLFMACCSVFIGGLLEIARKDDLYRAGGFSQSVGTKLFNASHISVFAQVPQFVFVGLGEVFTSVSGEPLLLDDGADFCVTGHCAKYYSCGGRVRCTRQKFV